VPINIGQRAPAKDTKAAGKQNSAASKGDPGGRMFGEAMKRLGSKKQIKATASSSNIARQGLAKVDRVTGPRGRVRSPRNGMR
jgi:hypothetical protein